MERQDPVATLLALTHAVTHALRAAMSLDGEPYPYDKWLHAAATQTPTGRLLAPHVDSILDLLATDTLRFEGPESDNPISQALHAIRNILIDAARAKGVNEPWLIRWWLYLNQRLEAISNVRW